MSRFGGCLDADAITHCVTTGMVEQFGCAFARIWLVESDRQALRLVASSGLYTRLNGSFARVPMGHFKVGKIAQNGIPFLSNSLPDETWVKDRAWALDNQLKGFAGLPLVAEQEAIGVLAVFSHQAMASEFLEVLQMLSVSVAGALASALNHQAAIQSSDVDPKPAGAEADLSERLLAIVGPQKLSLLGREKPVAPAIAQLLTQVAGCLSERSCHYCRLVYGADSVDFEAISAADAGEAVEEMVYPFFDAKLTDLLAQAEELGGTFKAQVDANQTVVDLRLRLPQQLSPRLARASLDESPLSEREREVIRLLAQGLRDREIAERLFISERTVKFHTKNMLNKLDVRTRIQAVFESTAKGWL